MLVCLDVDYRDDHAMAAGLMFDQWDSAKPIAQEVVKVSPIQPYEPGAFYKRELPCLQAVLQRFQGHPIETIIIDAFVELGPGHPGLGWHLYQALGQTIPVVGVAKTAFHSAQAEEVYRGQSQTPLYVTSLGLTVQQAADQVRRMHGPYRLPTLLKQVDRLCRDA
jgi:deoxyribonuclease V